MDKGQDQTLLDESLGRKVFVQYTGAKPPSNEQIAALEEDPGNVVYGRLQALNLFVILEAYDRYGVTVRSFDGYQSRSFVPWGAVLYMYKVDD